MNESKNGAMLYDTIPAVAGLNRVPGFDPRKLLRREISEATKEEVLKLDLKYKRLWFRLAHPEGRIRLNALRITEQLAIIEAQVYLDRNDPKPVSSFTSQRSAADTPSGLYVQEAEREAMNEALDNAGFGLQFCDVSHSGDEKFGTEIPLHREQTTVVQAVQPQAAAPAEERPQTAVPAVQEARPAESAPVQSAQTVQQPSPSVERTAPISAQTPVMGPVEKTGTTIQNTAPVANENLERVETPLPARTPAQADATAFQATAAEHTEELPLEEAAPVQEAGVRYTPDMPVDEICELMTLKEAQNLVVDLGTCKGWTMAQVAERRASSLKWYLFSDDIKNHVLKAAAKKLLDHLAELPKAG